MTLDLTFPVIAIAHSCFKEKFGVPRQPGLVTNALSEIELLPPYHDPEALAGLEHSTHLWLIFVFHLNKSTEWKPKVRPPRLGGNKQMGVFATRSPVRPSPIGMSAVKLEGIRDNRLMVSGADLVDGTPILDIKPYIPYSDCLPHAHNTFAEQPPERLPVIFSAEAEIVCAAEKNSNLKAIIEQTLALDPRPQYQRQDDQRIYGMTLFDKNIRWRCVQGCVQVIDITH